MSLPQRSRQFWDVVEPLATREGLQVVDLEYRAEHGGMVLRVFIDRDDGGVTVDDLSRFSRALGDLLEVHGEADARYTLEVSSPGVNRRLARPQDFARYVGRRVRVRTATPVAGRRNLLGTLVAASDADVVLGLEDGMEARIPLAVISRANYEHDFEADLRARQAGRRSRATPGRRRA